MMKDFILKKIEMLEGMGIDRQISLPLLKDYDGDVEKVIHEIFGY